LKIAIYGRPFAKESVEFIYTLFDTLSIGKNELHIHEKFVSFLKSEFNYQTESKLRFENYHDLDSDFDFFISIGGDGTFLESVDLVRNLNIPIIGINSGRLGFLANIAKENTAEAITRILNGDYEIEERTLLSLETKNHLFGEFNKALNEVTISRKDSSSMITIKAYVDGEYLNSYWTDGLIISTPTGSTGYSLSVGGPIVMPGTKNFIISPIAPHNLTVRPMVIPDDKEIILKVEGREESFLATLDFRSKVFDKSIELKIKKASYTIKTVKFKDATFFSTIRNKLMWGLDRRN
jgi:NAD+ kinase